MRNHPIVALKIILSGITLILPFLLFSQAQLVLNGADIVLNHGVKLVISNPNPAALTQIKSGGGLSSSGPNDNIVWMIGNHAGSYTVPFSAGGTSIPMSFTTAGATGNGFFVLGTYATPTWKNNDDLPPGVGGVGRNGSDNSSYTIDRFWQIAASGYTVKPALSNLIFSYAEGDWNKSGNAINEPSMAAQRWNDISGGWGDFAPAGRDDPNANTVTVPLVQAADLYSWWTMVDAAFALPVQLVSFTATADDKFVLVNWETATEINTSLFTIEKTKDRVHIASAGELPAAGNSTGTLDYSFTDKTPFPGTSYYRLKTTDYDGKLSYSQWRSVNIITGSGWQVFPNPVTDLFYIKGPATPANKVDMQLINTTGSILRQQALTNISTSIRVDGLPAGSYIVRINDNGNVSTFKIIKN